MEPKEYLHRFAAAVTKRSGICQATVEQVLPAVFDEIRYQLIEGKYPCVPIESFGTFGVIDVPEREYHYTYKCDKVVHLSAKKRLKFYMTRNFRQELERGEFDPSRRSFSRHPKDPVIRKRANMRYQPMKNGMHRGVTKAVTPQEPKSDQSTDDNP